MKRSYRADMAQETLLILRAGCYRTPSGQEVRIADELAAARDLTCAYPPDSSVRVGVADATPTRIEVTGESTLAAARRLTTAVSDCDPCCLNFASAKNPGGGFLGGAQAQEESLARSSGLYACIAPRREMYDYNRARSTCLYSDYMLYSPRVPVFRDDEGTLLETPYLVSFLTAPAVNAGAVRREERHLIEPTMRRRIERVLQIAQRHGHRILVLGAWGCGVFRNDPELVAELFAEQLNGEFHNVFAQVVFAVLDPREQGAAFTAFRERFPARR